MTLALVMFLFLQFVELLVRNLKEALKTNEFENARLMVCVHFNLLCHSFRRSSLPAWMYLSQGWVAVVLPIKYKP